MISGMPLRQQIAAALLLLAAAAIPQLLWLGAHVAAHPAHAGHAGEHEAELSELAKSLVHGHEHDEDVPDHEHHLVPSAAFQPDSPHDLQVPAIASLATPEAGSFPLSAGRRYQEGTGLSSSSPPRLHLLCTLLI
jgi:hypothetical protein